MNDLEVRIERVGPPHKKAKIKVKIILIIRLMIVIISAIIEIT